MVVGLVFQPFTDVPGVEQMVHDPNRVIAQAFGQGAEFQDLLRVFDAPVIGNSHTEFHVYLLGF